MDTITERVINEAATKIYEVGEDGEIVDTVTVTLNGEHGGADVQWSGETASGQSFARLRTIR